MGACFSLPVTKKELFDGETEHLCYCACGMQGWRPSMEDSHIAVTHLAGEPDAALFGVFDGHGGAEVAKFCQKYMPGAIADFLGRSQNSSGFSISESFPSVFHKMDDMLRDKEYAAELESLGTNSTGHRGTCCVNSILNRGNGRPSGAGQYLADEVGCTAVVSLILGDQLWVANAGDSRGVLCRGDKAVALSEDHKPDLRVEHNRIRNAGGFVDYRTDEARVCGELSVARAIGDLKFKDPKIPCNDQIVTAQPDVVELQITVEDKFLVLACDGVWDVMSSQQVVDFVKERLAQAMPLRNICTELLEKCLAVHPSRSQYGIGCDNMTVVIVQWKR